MVLVRSLSFFIDTMIRYLIEAGNMLRDLSLGCFTIVHFCIRPLGIGLAILMSRMADTTWVQAQDPVKIRVVLPFSGPNALFGMNSLTESSLRSQASTPKTGLSRSER